MVSLMSAASLPIGKKQAFTASPIADTRAEHVGKINHVVDGESLTTGLDIPVKLRHRGIGQRVA